jgi:hypothetical protein
LSHYDRLRPIAVIEGKSRLQGLDQIWNSSRAG